MMDKNNFLVKLTEEQIKAEPNNLYANSFMNWFINRVKLSNKFLYKLENYSDFSISSYYGLQNGQLVVYSESNLSSKNILNSSHIVTLKEFYLNFFTKTKNWIVYLRNQEEIIVSEMKKILSLLSFFVNIPKYDLDKIYWVGFINGYYVFETNQKHTELYQQEFLENHLTVLSIDEWYSDIFNYSFPRIESLELEESINSKRVEFGYQPIQSPTTLQGMLEEKGTGLEEPISLYDFIKPEHYKLWKDNNDTRKVIEASLTDEEYIGFCKGNILKYQLRLGKKPEEPIERDIKKIKEYSEYLENKHKKLNHDS